MNKRTTSFLMLFLLSGQLVFSSVATGVLASGGTSVSGSASITRSGVTAGPVVIKTGAASLSSDDIARINAEASAYAAAAKASGLVEKAKFVATLGKNAALNPLDSLYAVVAPLAMFVVGFFEQAAKQILKSNYMDPKLSILVDPSKQWTTLVAAEKNAVKKLAGMKTSDVSPAPSSKGIAQLSNTGWSNEWKGGNVGIVYDFGFGGAGDDLTQPLGFIRSEVSGKYYADPVRGQVFPQSMTMNSKPYKVDFRARPFAVLIPEMLSKLFSANVVNPMWSKFLNFTQLDPVGIFSMKVLLLVTTAFRNSFSKAGQIKTTDATQKPSVESWKYTSVKDGAKYPGVENLYTELSKLIQRLKVTPDIKRTIAANGGETVPSKWDLNKIVYMSDVDLGKLLLSILPTPLKAMLNLFKVKVNFYEYQAVIDRKSKTSVSDIELLYGKVRGYGSHVDDLAALRSRAANGEYVDTFIARLELMMDLVPKILWKDGAQNFTDSMKLFFLVRRLAGELFVGLEPIVTSYATGAPLDPAAEITVSADLQDASVAAEYVAGESGYYKDVDFELLKNKVLPARVAALRKYLEFAKKYTSSFVSSKIGDVMIDSRYRLSVGAGSSVGTVDDYATYFPQVAMKKILNDYVSLVGQEVGAVEASLNAQITSFGAVVTESQKKSTPFALAERSGTPISDDAVSAKIDALDKIVGEMRKRESAGQEVGVYPVGSDEKLLKIVEVPGVIYLAYCLDYLSGLLNMPFDGDAKYHFDDSFFDTDSSYLRLMAILLRANQDLSRAAKIVSQTSGPVEFKGAAGKYYTVPSGSEFYASALKVYDQNVLVQGQAMRDALAKHGGSSSEYQQALKNYLNNKSLLAAKKKEMNNILRTFEFDRRSGFGSGMDLKNTLKNKSLASVDTVVNTQQVASIVATVAPDSAAAQTTTDLAGHVRTAKQELAAAGAETSQGSGVVGTLTDGSLVYSYERSVNDFLQDELASLAFRTQMLNLQSLKDLVLAITGISAEDLWTGVQERKRLLLVQQQDAALAAIRPLDEQVVATENESSQEPLDDLMSDVEEDEGVQENVDTSIFAAPVPAVPLETGAAVEQAPVDAVVVRSPEANVSVAPAVVQNVETVSPLSSAVVEPVAPVAATQPLARQVVAPVVVQPAATEAVEIPVPSLAERDLDLVVIAANGEGFKSFNDEVGVIKLTSDLDALYAEAKKAVQDKNGAEFTESIKDLVFSCAQVVTPTEQVKSLFVSTLGKMINLMSFIELDSDSSEYKTMNNLLLVTSYLAKGLLSSQASELDPLAELLRSWIKAH